MSGASKTDLVPFTSAEGAWLWTMRHLMIRRAGGRVSRTDKQRPCDPDDVVKALDTLYRQRRIDLAHARVLRAWGERGRSPSPLEPEEKMDWRVWREAMDRLQAPLIAKGIVKLPAEHSLKS